MPTAIRVEEPRDAAAVYAVVASAFGRRDEADLLRALRADPDWVVGLVAVDASTIVGHVAFTRGHVDGHPVLALAPLAVAPDRQGSGIGRDLVQAGLARAADQGEAAVIVLGDPAYYGRFGFAPARELGISGPFGDIDEFQAVALTTPPRGRMAYPAAFGILPD